MKETALYIDHKNGSRFQRRFNVLAGGPDTIVIGANPESQIRLMGSGVSAIHAALEKRGEHWYLCDLGSTTGTWINGTSIVERKIEEGLLIFQVGPHTLRISFTTLGRELFVSEGNDSQGPTHHQIVVKKSGRIIETHVVAKDHTFNFYDGSKSRSCPPPRGAKWEVRTFGVYEVSQRLIAAETIPAEADFGIDPGMKKPLAGFAVLIVLGFFGKVFWPSAPQDELNLKISDNQYARMIYDSKLVKQKREESQKSQAGMKKVAPTQQAQTPTTETKKAVTVESAGQTALIKSVRASGLSSLIGKIAKRTSKNSIAIWTQGQSPESRGTGTVAVSASMDNLASAVGQKGIGAAAGVGSLGVKTVGKATGGSAYKAGTGLASNGVGSAQVGLIEEETEIEGGLDRDAIADVIRRDLGQIRYCYERQLSSSPDLYGKLTVKFSIDGQGMVSSQKIGTSTLSNAMVEGCILRRVAKWKFPNPKGGTIVNVSYPFFFKSAN